MRRNIAFENYRHSLKYISLFLWRWPEASKSNTTEAFNRAMANALFIGMLGTQRTTAAIAAATSTSIGTILHQLLSHVPFRVFSDRFVVLFD